MKAKLRNLSPAMVTLLVLALAGTLTAVAQGTAFTYQGRLSDDGGPAGGSYDLRFTLYDAVTNGTAVSGDVINAAMGISNGLFTATLNFGAVVFNGAERWLEIGVRTNGDANFATLSPRQAILPAPCAIYSAAAGAAVTATTATTATTANGVTANAVTGAGIQDLTVTAGKIASGQVVKSVNGLSDEVTLAAGANVTITPSGNLLTLAASAMSGWNLSGNAGTTGANFLGTMDDQPLEFKVNGTRALRMEPNTNSAPNVIGGSPHNFVATGIVGATIAGGGAINYGEVAYTNSVLADFGVIGGGWENHIASGSPGTCIGGGLWNGVGAASRASTIGGGNANRVADNSAYGTIAGGNGNAIGTTSPFSTIGGGWGNTMRYGSFGTIAGGYQNIIGHDVPQTGYYASVGGGFQNNAQGNCSVIPGGFQNWSPGVHSFAAGRKAKATHDGSFVWADTYGEDFYSFATDSVHFRCSGGVKFFGYAGGLFAASVAWYPGAGSWTFNSDRELKDRVEALDTRVVLEKISRLPISEWSYKGSPQRHIGAMAQDFHALFPLNDDDKRLNDLDLHGVALAAIQGLNQKVEARDTQIKELNERLSRLEALINQTPGQRTNP